PRPHCLQASVVSATHQKTAAAHRCEAAPPNRPAPAAIMLASPPPSRPVPPMTSAAAEQNRGADLDPAAITCHRSTRTDALRRGSDQRSAATPESPARVTPK